MTLKTVASVESMARREHPDHLAALPPGQAFRSEFWTEVHDEVQAQFALLETEVCRMVAEVRVDAGRTKGESFFLFSYRTFSMPDSVLDPVVIGMTFTPADQDVKVRADVSGEQTGDWISSVPSKTVAKSREELLTTARELARKLCQSAEATIAALKNPARKVE